MNCIDVDLRLQGYFDAELDSSGMSLIQRHLFNCRSCRKQFQKLKFEMRDLLVDLAEPRISIDAIQKTVNSSIERIRPRHPLPAPAFSLGLAVLIAVGLSLFAFQIGATSDEKAFHAFDTQIMPASFSRTNPAAEEILNPPGQFEIQIFSTKRSYVGSDEIVLISQSTGELVDVQIEPLSWLWPKFQISKIPPGKYQLMLRSECIPLEIQPGTNLPLRVYLAD